MLNKGQEFQDYVFDKLYEIGIPLISYSSKKYQIEKGENKAGVEIKFDDNFAKTNNFWIEVAEKYDPKQEDWFDSGIKRDDNTWLYIIGNYDIFYIFAKRHLMSLLNKESANGKKKYPIRISSRKTSKGFLLDKQMADCIATRVLYFNQNKSQT